MSLAANVATRTLIREHWNLINSIECNPSVQLILGYCVLADDDGDDSLEAFEAGEQHASDQEDGHDRLEPKRQFDHVLGWDVAVQVQGSHHVLNGHVVQIPFLQR